MKKGLIKTFTSALLAALMCFSLTACREKDWKGNVSLLTPGEVVSNGGFVIDTENYVYFINGVESNTANNTTGEVVKGALMVAEKNGETIGAPQTVVSKIICSQDYSAGIYLFGNSLYYATPSTKKDSSGKVVNTHLEFYSSSLDGNSRTEYLRIASLTVSFRIVEKDGSVFLVYYDTDSSSVVEYSFASKTSKVIVENPSQYFFLDNETVQKTGISVIYSQNPTNEKTGSQESYNEVYVYKNGDGEGTKVLSGENGGLKDVVYSLSFVSGENLFLTETLGEDINYYGIKVEDLDIATPFTAKAVKYAKNTSLVAETTIFDSLKKAYVVDGGFVTEYSYEGDEGDLFAGENKKVVAVCTSSDIVTVNGGYIYYKNSEEKLARIELGDADAHEATVSEGMLSSWYSPCIKGRYVFFADGSDKGNDNVYYIDLETTTEVQSNEDDDNPTYKLTGVTLLGVKTAADKASECASIIKDLSSIGQIVFEDGEYKKEDEVTAAREAYEALGANKSLVAADTVKILTNYEGYFAASKKLKVLIDKFAAGEKVTEDNKAEWQAKIDEIRKIFTDYGWGNTEKDKLIENGMYSLQKAEKEIKDLDA